MKLLHQIIQFPFILTIRIYQLFISPIFPSKCRYQPTCSHYAIEAIKEWGIFKGIYLGTKRISRCHPWGSFGHDPVPKKPTKNQP